MKTTSRLALACIAFALILTSAVIYAAPAPPARGSAGAQTTNTKARRKTTRRRRARRSVPVAKAPTGEIRLGTTGGGKGGGTEPNAPAPDDGPPPTTPAPTPAPKKMSIVAGGVLNGRAISKPQPAYPAIAKAARAQGTVVVQIVVGEDGRVISASAVSGHPLLQQTAVSAARQARFSPTLLSGQPVKVSGVITYNFVLK